MQETYLASKKFIALINRSNFFLYLSANSKFFVLPVNFGQALKSS